MRIQFEIKESLANILDQLTHSDFWATEIKEDESGKKIIKIKDLAVTILFSALTRMFPKPTFAP